MGAVRGGGTCVRENNYRVGVEGRVVPPAEPRRADDGLQPTLRSGFQPRLTPSVRLCGLEGNSKPRRDNHVCDIQIAHPSEVAT